MATGSPSLQAKKAHRDAKRKQLQAMFDQHKGTEEKTQSQASAISEPKYSSYQNTQPDLEAASPSVPAGHVVWMGSENEETGYQQGRLLREQAQSLIHMVEDQVQQHPNTSSAVVLQKIQDNPRSFLGTVFAFFLLYWWL